MGTVIFDISMSIDGFISARGMTADEGMGVGGEVLHDWAFRGDDQDGGLLERAGAALGAVIAGRRTYDNSIKWWGADGPTGTARVPLFVVSHEAPADVPAKSVYTFVDGTQAALDAARATAGDGDIGIMGGGDIAGQYLAAGLIDEISIHVAPVIFGSGTPLFGTGSTIEEHVRLERVECIATDAATHLRFRVLR